MNTPESPIACQLDALTVEQRTRRVSLLEALRGRAVRVDVAGEGFAFRFPFDYQTWMDAAEFITLERLCCPFLEFNLAAERESGAIALTLSGRPGVKAFLRSALDLPELIQL